MAQMLDDRQRFETAIINMFSDMKENMFKLMK